MSTHNIGFYGELEKIIPDLSSASPLRLNKSSEGMNGGQIITISLLPS